MDVKTAIILDLSPDKAQLSSIQFDGPQMQEYCFSHFWFCSCP